MCHINYYICCRCYHGYARFTNLCPDMHPPRTFCPKGTPFHLRIVDETECYLYPYHTAPMPEGHLSYRPNGGNESNTSHQDDKSVTSEGRRFIGQYPNQRTDPPSDNPTVYGFGSASYVFYPWHGSPVYPFYYPVAGNTPLHGPLQTPPPPPKSQLASPTSNHVQEASKQTMFNPQAQVFQPEREPTMSQEEQSQDILESTELNNKELFYSSQRGISRSLCSDAEYQSNLDIYRESISAYDNNQSGDLALHTSTRWPSLSVSSQRGTHFKSARDLEQEDPFTTSSVARPTTFSREIGLPKESSTLQDTFHEHDKLKSDLKATTKEDASLLELSTEDAGFEFNNQLEFADKCRDKFLRTSSESVYHKPQDFARQLDFSAHRNHGRMPKSKGTPQSTKAGSIETKKLFGDEDFPALGSPHIAGTKNSNQASESSPMFAKNATASAPTTLMSWSRILSGKHTQCTAAVSSPALPLSHQPDDKEMPSPNTAISDKSKEEEATKLGDGVKQQANEQTPLSQSETQPVLQKSASLSLSTTSSTTTPSIPEHASPDQTQDPVVPEHHHEEDEDYHADADGSLAVSDTSTAVAPELAGPASPPAPPEFTASTTKPCLEKETKHLPTSSSPPPPPSSHPPSSPSTTTTTTTPRPRLWSQLVGGSSPTSPATPTPTPRSPSGARSAASHASGSREAGDNTTASEDKAAWPALGAHGGGKGKGKGKGNVS